VSLVAFTPILWNQSGPLTFAGVTVPRALFWMVFVYVFVGTIVAFWLGRPLIRLSFRNELTNAALRYALVRLRDAGESIGLYCGVGAESGQLASRFDAIITNYRAFVRRNIVFLGWNQAMTRITELQDSLSWFRSVYDSFASYRAAIIRLEGSVMADEEPRQLPQLAVAPSTDGSVVLEDVEVRTPSGQRLVERSSPTRARSPNSVIRQFNPC
jgi:putative ATP-binding cassette transporter